MIVNILKFYKRNQIDALMFGYVNAIMFNLPTVTIEKALLNFQKHHGLTEDNFNIETNKKTYARMREEFLELEKTQKKYEAIYNNAPSDTGRPLAYGAVVF